MGRDDRFCPKCGTSRPEEATVVSHVSLRNAQAAHLAEVTKGEFEISRQLGLGAMGSVYLAKDVALGRQVAIKVIASNLLQDESMVSRFALEAQTVASLRHPNIVNVHAVRQSEDLHFFVMDYIDGPALRSIVKNHAPLEVAIVQALMYQVGSALDYAHRRGKGVIHRDIKPANIMVDLEGDAFVTDFGISKIAESQTGLTQTGATIGTPEYMSPEQCRGEELTGASDQYAVGIVAYEMLCGKTPFSGSQYFIMVAHTSEEPTPILELRPDCPAHVAEAVHRMLAKTPEERWPDLEAAMAAMGGAPLSYRDPIRTHITQLAGSTAQVKALDTAEPLSPLPSRTTGGSTPPRSDPSAPTVRMSSEVATPSTADPSVSDTATSVTVIGVPTRIEVGDAFTLAADVRGATHGSLGGAAVDWASTDPSIAVVAGGRVEAMKAGTAMISATVGGVSNTVSVIVAEASAASVTIEPERVHVSSGERVSLAVHVHDKRGRDLDRPVRWLTSDASVASVTRDGEVVATGSGVVTVTAESSGVTGTAEVIVQGTGARIPIALRPGGVPFYRRPAVIGGGLLVASIASVFGAYSAGMFGASEPGDVGGNAAALVASVEVSAGTEPLTVGDSIQITALARDDGGQEVAGENIEWASTTPELATFGADGWLRGLAEGTAALSVVVDGVPGEATVEVRGAAVVADNTPTPPVEQAASPPPTNTETTQEEIPEEATRPDPDPPEEEEEEAPPPAQPSSLDLLLPQTAMVMGDQQTITGRVIADNGEAMPDRIPDIRWNSSNRSVLTVDQRSGAIEAVGAGSAEIEARLGSVRASISIVVATPPVEEVQIQGGARSLEVSDTESLTASVRGPGGMVLEEAVSWSSSNPNVVTVNTTGRITAVGAGSANIVATAGGVEGSVSVSVAEPAPTLPSTAEAQAALTTYVEALNEGDDSTIRDLFGSGGEDELDDLLELMGQPNFTATLGDVPEPAMDSGTPSVDVQIKLSYRSGFGGSRDSDRMFKVRFASSGSRWTISSAVMLPD
jgi:serine/threonine protein kinase